MSTATASTATCGKGTWTAAAARAAGSSGVPSGARPVASAALYCAGAPSSASTENAIARAMTAWRTPSRTRSTSRRRRRPAHTGGIRSVAGPSPSSAPTARPPTSPAPRGGAGVGSARVSMRLSAAGAGRWPGPGR
ncbi:hypothetical protein E7744_12320 [Citricoccus sp. SGAir0253]|nr:hypothetical protein E7744_12320 [Citricoccus sp. SGAir0253]